ncbi:hypothetical protein [Maribacter sp. HTCC2170]|uniref:hypothetical protein n=1 Tax=Maribacter sp. (strain HTCC2170 / KCCM 42371) TaxID=313603 RepID=UPI0003188850|nr:hypothetical protein [Maribacter sp. HTCC2170]
MIANKKCLFLLVFLVTCLGSYSQSVTKSIIHHVYDGLVGLDNTGLFNGPEFKDQYLDSWDDSHIYLNSSAIMSGTVVYNNQFYTKVLMKYDILEDNLIIRSNDKLNHFLIKPLSGNISQFRIHNKTFVRLMDEKLNLEGNGFFEAALQGERVSLYIKQVKKRKRQTVDNVLQYRFYQDNYYVLLYKGKYHTIFSIKDLKNVIPDKYKQIRNFQKQNKTLYRNNMDSFMTSLVKFLDAN